MLLRPGVIPLPEIEALIGPVRVAARHARGSARIAGHAPAALPPARPRCTSAKRPRRDAARGLRIEGADARREFAAALYDTLHRLDREGWDWIAVEQPPDTPEWAGVLDRLRRAAR